MKNNKTRTESRRTTPLPGLDNASPMQAFIDSAAAKSYDQKCELAVFKAFLSSLDIKFSFYNICRFRIIFRY